MLQVITEHLLLCQGYKDSLHLHLAVEWNSQLNMYP